MIKTFLKNTKGNFGVIMALVGGVLALGIGVAIDTSGVTKVNQRLQATLDMALLAAATNPSHGLDTETQSEADYAADVHTFMLANGYDPANPVPIVQVENSHITAQVTNSYQTSFGGIIGIKKIDINVDSQVTLKGSAKVQIALVLDNTASMSLDGKMIALKSGARDLVDAVKDAGSQSEIAIVPFAKYVRIDTSHRGEPWLVLPHEYDTDRSVQQATHSGGICEIVDQEYEVDGTTEIRPTTVCRDQITTYETQYRVVESRWEGCVGVRDQPLDSLDGNFVTPVPGLLNIIPHEITVLNIDVKPLCPRSITPLTNDYTKLIADINRLYGTGKTYIPGGLTWGQRVLSPIAPFEEASSSDAVKNIMVIMSDGKNTAEIRDTTETNNNYEAPPYIFTAGNDEAVPAANTLTAELCAQIKEQGTDIYTIAFRINDTTTESVLRDCASSTSKVFVASDNAGLVRAFGYIANSLENVIRLSK